MYPTFGTYAWHLQVYYSSTKTKLGQKWYKLPALYCLGAYTFLFKGTPSFNPNQNWLSQKQPRNL
jgi:hypothetical protein